MRKVKVWEVELNGSGRPYLTASLRELIEELNVLAVGATSRITRREMERDVLKADPRFMGLLDDEEAQRAGFGAGDADGRE